MSKQTPARHAFRVGRFHCTMTMAGDNQVNVEWKPHLPKHLSKDEQKAYRAGRDACVAKIASAGKALVVEV